jgi:TRAP-type C4-dicarboxylate transport system permease small subunit
MSSWLSFVVKLKQLLIVVEKFLAASSLLLLLIFAVIQVVARNFFDTGFPELDVISRHLVLFIIFMGAALVSEYNKHIKIDIVAVFLNKKQQQNLIRPLLLLSAAVCAIFTWYSIQFWLDEWTYAPANEQWSLYLALIIPVGFFMLGLHLLLLVFTGFESQSVDPDPGSDPGIDNT